MTTIIKAADAAHFLSLVPQVLGFAPTRSLVLVPFSGTRSAGAMRLDLPADDTDVDAFSATCIGLVCRVPETDAVAAVVYTDESFTDDRPPHADLARALLSRADACGLRVTDALCVGADAWGSYVDPECPPTGRPLTELDLAAPADLEPVSGDQAAGAELPAVDAVTRERVGRALVALERSIGVVCGDAATSRESSRGRRPGKAEASEASDGAADAASTARIDPQALAAVCLLDDLPALFEDSLRTDPARFDPYHCAALAWCLARPALRDVALVQWCSGFGGGDEALSAQLRWEAGEPYPDHLAERMWGEGDQPDPARLGAALALARYVAAVAPEALRPGPLAVCAWLSWALGRSTHAERYATQGCGIEPEHGLSEIVLTFVAAGHLPDWAFRRAAPGRRPSRAGITPKKRAKRR